MAPALPPRSVHQEPLGGGGGHPAVVRQYSPSTEQPPPLPPPRGAHNPPPTPPRGTTPPPPLPPHSATVGEFLEEYTDFVWINNLFCFSDEWSLLGSYERLPAADDAAEDVSSPGEASDLGPCSHQRSEPSDGDQDPDSGASGGEQQPRGAGPGGASDAGPEHLL